MQHQSTSVRKRYVIFVSFHMHSSLSFATCFFFFLSFLFFSSRKRLEAVRARFPITTWGGEWHLESDRWKGIKFSLEPTVWNWYSLPPRFSTRKHSTALTYLNRGSSLILDTRPVPRSGAGRGNWMEVEGRKLSNCPSELMPFNLFLSRWAIMKKYEKGAETWQGEVLIVPLQ